MINSKKNVKLLEIDNSNNNNKLTFANISTLCWKVSSELNA